jgi:hypothetical protein
MEQQLSEPLKAILLKIAMELKKFRWKTNVHTSEISVFQGHLDMSKDYIYDGGGENPDVDVTIGIDMTFQRNEQNNVYFLTYQSTYSNFVQGVGGSDRENNSDIDVPFTEQDVNNQTKFIEAAKKINDQTMQEADQYAYEHSQESGSDWNNQDSQDTVDNFDR